MADVKKTILDFILAIRVNCLQLQEIRLQDRKCSFQF